MKSTLYSELLEGIDDGINAHLAWNQRLLRSALLRKSPGEDVMQPNAHDLCQFGMWFNAQKKKLEEIDSDLTHSINEAHRLMHDAVRILASGIIANTPAQDTDLQLYEKKQTSMITMLQTLRQKIEHISMRFDSLTGLPMRHGLEHAFTIRLNDASRIGAQLWVLLADIDHFKSVNDTHGHSIGDMAISHTANQLRLCLRKNDILFRYGGEEFLALLLVTSDDDIQNLAERMLHSISTPLVLANQTINLTATLGLTPVSPDEKLRTVIDRADFALLKGKKSGRNRYIIADKN